MTLGSAALQRRTTGSDSASGALSPGGGDLFLPACVFSRFGNKGYWSFVAFKFLVTRSRARSITDIEKFPHLEGTDCYHTGTPKLFDINTLTAITTRSMFCSEIATVVVPSSSGHS